MSRFIQLLLTAFVALFSYSASAEIIPSGTTLLIGQPYYSDGQMFHLQMQNDGNLVLYRNDGSVRWNSQTFGNPGASAKMQQDGNFVIYSQSGTPIWNTATFNNSGAYLSIERDGSLGIYTNTNSKVWNLGSDTATLDICDNQAIPPYYIVVRRYTGSSCTTNGSFNYATRSVRPIISPINVCAEAAIPQGYVVTKMDTSTNCMIFNPISYGRQTWTISLPTSPMRVCSRSVQPAGYVITQQATDAQNCALADMSTTNAAIDIKIPANFEPHVCTFSLLPPNFKIVQALNWPQCGGMPGTNNAVSIQRIQ